ncbi:hypothetical protein Shyd_69560 [Streptomyces hydrogenans]|uniref:GGDEF domain-containing protein n=1 Tax=Streptomyces hydrogenans TaxID=1873719 RepID=A0ABQ3PKP5_9ACTN|nr:diguanylate cyclase [Streptomyces hydrogenans]GHI25585.1 hypothetical protein Shyd_69560 [Streptomyces hydrogenans]
MDPVTRVPGPIGQRALLITTLAVPLTGWTLHALTLHRRLAAERRDPLTGAQRRAAFERRAQRLLARHRQDALLCLVDLDHFKGLNDTHGHAAGDAALAATGERGVAGGVAVGVVQALEVVEVDQAEQGVLPVAGEQALGAAFERGTALGSG